MEVLETNAETGLREDTLLKPYQSPINNWGKCASYDLEKHSKELTKVAIRSPLDVYVIFHSKDQLSIPKELSTKETLEGFHLIDVTIDKTIDLKQDDKPCYDTSEHSGESYGEHEYKLLTSRTMERFNCTTPFIPAEFRNGSNICLNQTAASLVHEFLQYSSSSFVTNMWKSNYYSIPPCVYHTYTVAERARGKGKVSE